MAERPPTWVRLIALSFLAFAVALVWLSAQPILVKLAYTGFAFLCFWLTEERD